MIKIGARCAHWSASAILATVGVDCRSSVLLVFAYLCLGNPFSGSLTGSRQRGLGYLQGAAGCWWLAAGVSSHVTAVICPMVAHAARSTSAEDFGTLVQAFVT